MTGRTECLEILRRMRIGLNLTKEKYIAVHYTVAGLVTVLKFEDGKLYKITIEEVESEIVGPVDSSSDVIKP